jgi:NAD(P)-dependent dehydrogenase (short-subunit alcohol dehydrogenase family)
MSRIFISGSTTGLGLMAGELLASQSHRVVLHARNAERAEDAGHALHEAEAVVVGLRQSPAQKISLPRSMRSVASMR